MFAVSKGRVYGGLSAVVAGTAIAMATAACGHQAVDHGHQLQIAETEYRLRPNHITVPAGTLTVVVHNYGELTHNLVVVRSQPATTVLTTTTGVETETSTVVARTPDLPPGASATVTVPLRPSRYGIASILQDDQGQGMQGYITVPAK